MTRSRHTLLVAVSSACVAGVAAALAVDIHVWPHLARCVRYWRVGMLPTASDHLVPAVVLPLAIALAVAVVLLAIAGLADLRRREPAAADERPARLTRLLALVVIGIAFVALGSRLNTAPWFPGFLTVRGLVLNALTTLGALALAFVVWRPLPAVGCGLAAALALVALVAVLHHHDLRRRTPIWLVSVSEQVGLIELNNTLGAAWGDADDDGWLDLYISNHIPITTSSYLYQNDGGRRFLKRRMAAGDYHGPAWCDYDNDGVEEIFVAGGNNTPVGPPFANMLFRRSEGAWSDVAPQIGVGNLAGRCWGGAWADVDADGLCDLVVADYFTPNRLFRNRGDGSFEDISLAAGIADVAPATTTMMGTRAASWADVDGDGDMDLLMSALVTGLVLYRNDGQRGDATGDTGARNPGPVRFSEIAREAGLVVDGPLGTEEEPRGLAGCAWGDYDNDLDLDLYVGSAYRNLLFRNRGDGSFDEVGVAAGVADAGPTGGVAWGDLDCDGDLDLMVTVESDEGPEEPDARDRLYLNRGDGSFVDIAVAAGATGFPDPKGQTVALADYDQDGALDVLVLNQRVGRGDRGPARRWMQMNLLLRNAGNVNHWLEVRLHGTVSNRDGIGARVFVKAAGREQLREQNGGSHLFAQHAAVLHFGLGDAERVDAVRVVWPSGIVQTVTEPGIDRILTIEEPRHAD